MLGKFEGERRVEIEKSYVGISDDRAEGEFEISVYEDAGCTEDMEDIDFGPIKPGEEKIVHHWIKNTGDSRLGKICIGMGVIGSDGWESRLDSYVDGPLEVGEKMMASFQLKVEPDTEPGEYAGSIPIEVYEEEDMF